MFEVVTIQLEMERVSIFPLNISSVFFFFLISYFSQNIFELINGPLLRPLGLTKPGIEILERVDHSNYMLVSFKN